MADLKANAAEDRRPSVTVTGAGQATLNQGTIILVAALALNDTVALMKLPAGHIPVDFILDCDELDTGVDAIVMDVGIIGGDVDALISGSDVGQAGGIARMDQSAGRRLAPLDVDQLVGVTVTTAPGTGATDVVMTGTLISRVANIDD